MLVAVPKCAPSGACLRLRARNHGHVQVHGWRPPLQGSWPGRWGCQKCRNAVWKALPLVGTWGLWILKNHKKWTILQSSLRTIIRAAPLCSGAQTELQRTFSKTGVLVMTTDAIYCHTDGPKTANFQVSAKITIFEDIEVGLGDGFTAREGSSRHARGISSSDLCGGREPKL